MNRIELVKKYVSRLIEALPEERKGKAYIHTYGVAQICALLCRRRGLAAEMGLICGLLHEIYYYEKGTYEAHAEKGALMAKTMLEETGLFSKAEIVLIQNAIHHHDFRELSQGPYDEALKDADTFSPYLEQGMENSNERVGKVLEELGFSCTF